MSGSQPVRPQRRELEILRALFERSLKDRAIALAESRWPGSGRMVDLAYEWPALSPTERRARMSEIGPEQIARLRSLAALHPDLDAAVTELDRRGVLPHLEAAAQAGLESAASEPAPEHATAEPAAAGPGDGEQEQPAAEEAPAAEPAPAARQRVDDPGEPVPLDEGVDGQDPEPPALEVDMPDLDLGLPSTAEFLSAETDRRAQAMQSAEAALERVRQRLDRSTERAMNRASETRLPSFESPTPVALPELPPATSSSTAIADADRQPSTMVEAPDWLLDRFEKDVVVALAREDEAPSDDELVALANALGVRLKEFWLEPGSLRKVYGGLVNRAGLIDVEAGPLPASLADGNLVVVRGRMYPSVLRRLRDGYADIPGTRATVRLHEKARLLVIQGG